MATGKKSGSSKKFGTRYGITSRQKYARIDALQKTSYACPYCRYPKVKRLNTGIWYCSKCDTKFTSKAYTVPKNAGKQKEIETEQLE